MYGNVEYVCPERSPAPPLPQISYSEDSDIYLQEDSIYEPVRDKEKGDKKRNWLRSAKFRCKEQDTKTWTSGQYRRKIRFAALSIGLVLIVSLILLAGAFAKYSAMVMEMEALKEEKQKALATGSFLIYNEAHNRCAEVRNSSSSMVLELTASSCTPTSLSQLFRWLPGARILNVAVELCVGVRGKIQSNIVLRLVPCETPQAKSWVCTNETLFGLKGERLYFNYGNNLSGVVMLFDGNGVWSRWKAHGLDGTLQNEGVCAQMCE
ncbi:macrophage mannose receptor 1 isoform X3 [Xenopus laevis]|uniref:Ricin B lectin domain-containing protein n=2 Tax=Xenopus laevis TaxID=8355 RepID=A0A974HTX0_XENLA|nr:macrophage mannose receptor 1 isoform X3 [Xenopus laevis]OCT90317.1 hypothetical protein XELAEV_18018929mg [Xenopus laevis]